MPSAQIVTATLSQTPEPIWPAKATPVTRVTRSFHENAYRHGGIMIEKGQILYDNDPRYPGRKLEVVRVEDSYAICKSGPRQMKVRLDRIHSDGAPRHSGYSTVAPG